MDLLLALDYAFFSLTDDKEHVVNKKEFINQINSLYSLAWSLTASVSSLLDQVGIPAHRVFSENSIEDQILSEKEMINFKTSKES